MTMICLRLQKTVPDLWTENDKSVSLASFYKTKLLLGGAYSGRAGSTQVTRSTLGRFLQGQGTPCLLCQDDLFRRSGCSRSLSSSFQFLLGERPHPCSLFLLLPPQSGEFPFPS